MLNQHELVVLLLALTARAPDWSTVTIAHTMTAVNAITANGKMGIDTQGSMP